jgi:hypothetical protein
MKKPPKRQDRRTPTRLKPSRGPTPPKEYAYEITPEWLEGPHEEGCPVCSGGECTGLPGCVARRP